MTDGGGLALPAEETVSLRREMAENQRIIDELNARLGRKTEEVRIIQQIAAELNATLELDAVLCMVLTAMDNVLGFRHCMVLLADEAGENLELAASHGYEDAAPGARVPVGQGTIGVVARRRRMLRIGSLRSKLSYLASVRRHVETQGQTWPGQSPRLPGLADADSQIAIPLVVKDRLVGVFMVESTEPNAFDELDELLLSIVGNQVANAIDNARLHRSVIERSQALDRANAALSGLNATLESRVAERTRALEEALGHVRDEQGRSAAMLRRMAPPEVIPLMLEGGLVPGRLDATILFTDLENFTGYAADMEPDEVFSLLNEYFSWAGEIVQRYRGYVNKINGDGMMAVFGVPFGSPTHRSDAAMAALTMQCELRERFPFHMRIGLNSGRITAGMLGPASKSLYDVLGPAANLASRMEAVCPVDGIALPASAAEPLRPWFEIAALGDLEVRGLGRMACATLDGLRPLAADRRRIAPDSRFATAFADVIEQVERIAAERIDMVDLTSIQARDAAFLHNEAVASFALALHRSLAAAGAAEAAAIGEEELVLAALLHDVGKHAIDPRRLNDKALSAEARAGLREELRDRTLEALDRLSLGRLAPVLASLYAFEACRGATGTYEPAVEILAAADIYDALTAPKLYDGAPWRITGALEELLRLPWCSGTQRPVFAAFVDLMKPAQAKLAIRPRSRILLQ
ncbi:adenylate/guanylate cyclase domain-containing protein [Marinibaculum pumilum]|uniref:Adenylate/guanylate cyclase domain-containing protein n=1 Tax=Marinibaculum pumilum TaxID=1766165 RepID=A0ABV7L044_9PROT